MPISVVKYLVNVKELCMVSSILENIYLLTSQETEKNETFMKLILLLINFQLKKS